MTERDQDDAVANEDLPYQTVESPGGTWIEIATAGSEEEATLIKGFLESQDIPCQIESLRNEELPVNFGKLAEIRVYVSEENQSSAQGLLAERERDYVESSPDGSVVTDDGLAVIPDDAQTMPEEEP